VIGIVWAASSTLADSEKTLNAEFFGTTRLVVDAAQMWLELSFRDEEKYDLKKRAFYRVASKREAIARTGDQSA